MRILIIIIAILFASPSWAAETKCGSLNVFVKSETEIDAANVCKGVTQAVRFLKANGFNMRTGFSINIVDHIQTKLPVVVLAKYNPKTSQIDIVSFERCRKLKKKTIFGLKIDRVLHRSFVVHEVAHAVIRQNIQPQLSSRVIQEYIAYTAQIATLPLEYRISILERYQTEGFRSDEEFSSTFFCLDPDLFAVKSYKHFLRPENGAAFYNRIRNGTFQPSEELYLICR